MSEKQQDEGNDKYSNFFQAQRDVSPDGFHPKDGSYYDEGGEGGVQPKSYILNNK